MPSGNPGVSVGNAFGAGDASAFSGGGRGAATFGGYGPAGGVGPGGAAPGVGRNYFGQAQQAPPRPPLAPPPGPATTYQTQPGAGQADDFLTYMNRPSFFPSETFVPFSPQTDAALNWTQDRALAGSPLQRGAQDEIGYTMGGGYMPGAPGGNPYLDAMFEKTSRLASTAFKNNVLPGANAAFSMSNRSGSPAHQQAIGDLSQQHGAMLGDMATSIYGGAYENERNRMFGATQMAPQFAELDYRDPARLAQVGQTREGLAGEALQDQIARFDYDQNRDIRDLSTYHALLQGQGGQFGTSSVTGSASQPLHRNKMAGALGGAASGASIGTMIMPGWGTAIGAGVGGLAGLF